MAARPRPARRKKAKSPARKARTPRRRAAKHAPESLRRYREMRDFDKTAEPSGGETVPDDRNLFIVQKHAASHLHYDFRLALDGVLKSWAVAKGPSVDPAVKRLAMQTEDHPMAYGSFEGTIPKGQYGGGTVMLWDRGTWRPTEDPHAGFSNGRLKFELNGKKMKGLWALIRMKPRPGEHKAAWLLIKDRDEAAHPGDPEALLAQDKSVKTGRGMNAIAAGKDVWVSNRAPKQQAPPASKPKAKARKRASAMAAFFEPELATRVDHVPPGDDWAHEVKFDGYRLHCRIVGDDVTIITRREENWTGRFPELVAACRALDVEEAYLDGEAVVVDKDGKSDFSGLQNWFTTGAGKFVYYAFDLLWRDGEDLRDQPLTERKAALKDVLKSSRQRLILYSDHQLGEGKAFFQAASKAGLEGILSKKADAPYRAGRSRDWLKIKCIQRQEFVIGGFVKSTVSEKAIGSLLLGEYQDGALVYVGKVGTGFSHQMAGELHKRLSAIRVDKPAFAGVLPSDVRRGATWTKPALVAEIEFAAWTSDHILRHAAFMGLREDKTPREVKPEKVIPLKEVTTAKATKAPAKSGKGADVLGVAISHPERIYYPEQKISKLDVARYYEAVAEVMLPHVADRPLSLVRCPDGIAAQCFFQKHAGAGLPEAIHEIAIGDGPDDTVLLVDSAEGLVSLVQRGVLEIHIWGSHLKTVEKPDLLVFDFDPDPAVKWPEVVRAAVEMRDFLDDIGLKSFTKTTGGKGLHVVVPIKPMLEWDAVKEFTRLVSTRFSDRAPERFLVNMSKAKRTGRIFIDYLRNGRGSTAIAPYSTRARPGGQIATPVSWKELKDGAVPADFTLASVPQRIGKRFKDPWAEMRSVKQAITVKMIKALSG